MATRVLSLTLPSLVSGVEQPLQLPCAATSTTSSSSSSEGVAMPWFRVLPVVALGTAYSEHVAWQVRLRGEVAPLAHHHHDPTAPLGRHAAGGVQHKKAATGNAHASDDDDDGGSDEDDSDDDDDDDEAAALRRHGAAARRKRAFVKLSDEDLQVDWYDVLQLPQREGATVAQIRAAYRRRCLETHPDKQQNHSDELFKRVQRAFDILGDAETRLSYDSARPFDDAIPGDNVSAEAFYATFAPVFERNKRWSVERDLPSLGDDDAPYAAVQQFYDRWAAFHTKRDFAHLVDLAEIDEGMCREEKRYYMRENARQLASLHRDELRRIRTLVERARAADPRLRRHKEAQEAARLAEQHARDAFRQRMRDDQQRQRDAAAAEEQARVAAAAAAQQAARQAVRQAHADLVAFLHSHALLDATATNKLLRSAVRKPNVQWLFAKMTSAAEATAVTRAVCDARVERVDRATAAATARAAAAAVKRAIAAHENDATPTATAHTDGAEEGDDDDNDEDVADDDGEDDAAGVVECVAVFNRLVRARERRLGLTRYGEPLKKRTAAAATTARTASSTTATAATPQASEAAAVVWTEDDLSRLQKATAKFPPGTVERWAKIRVALRNRFTEEQAMAKVNEITAALHKQQQQQHAADTAAGSAAAATTSAATPSSSQQQTHAAAATAAALSVEDWTVKQHKQLELALRELKDYKEKDKFQKIAKMVEGKTAKECFERFRYLCTINKRT